MLSRLLRGQARRGALLASSSELSWLKSTKSEEEDLRRIWVEVGYREGRKPRPGEFAPTSELRSHKVRSSRLTPRPSTDATRQIFLSALSYAVDFAFQTPSIVEEAIRSSPAPLTRTPMLHSEALPTYHFVQPPRILRTSHPLHALKHRVVHCLVVIMASSMHFCSALRLEFGDAGRDAARRRPIARRILDDGHA